MRAVTTQDVFLDLHSVYIIPMIASHHLLDFMRVHPTPRRTRTIATLDQKTLRHHNSTIHPKRHGTTSRMTRRHPLLRRLLDTRYTVITLSRPSRHRRVRLSQRQVSQMQVIDGLQVWPAVLGSRGALRGAGAPDEYQDGFESAERSGNQAEAALDGGPDDDVGDAIYGLKSVRIRLAAVVEGYLHR